MIKQTFATVGAAAMFGLAGLAIANDAQTPSTGAAPTAGDTQKRDVDARQNETERKPESGTSDTSKQ